MSRLDDRARLERLAGRSHTRSRRADRPVLPRRRPGASLTDADSGTEPVFEDCPDAATLARVRAALMAL